MATDLAIQRQTTNDPLVPEPVSAQIIQQMPASSAVLSLARRFTMPALTHRIPVLSVLPFAYFVGGDTGLKSTDRQQWRNVNLVAEEIAVIVPVPEQYFDDAQVPIWDEVRPRLVEAAGALVDGACLFGTNKPVSWGDPVYQRAVAAGNRVVTGFPVGSEGVLPDMAAEIAYLGETLALDGFNVTGFASRPGLNWRLTRLRSNDGVPIYQPDLTQPRRGSLYGLPLNETLNGAWDITEAQLIAGDWSQAIVGVRQDISFRVFDSGVISDDMGNIVLNLMQQDSLAIRMTLRLAWAVANPANRLAQDSAGESGGAPAENVNRWPFAVLSSGSYTYS